MTELDIIFKDNHLFAANKPAGLLSQDSGIGEENLEQMARNWIVEIKNKPGEAYLHAVHRLDRSASGVVLFARTSKALTRLQTSMRAGEIERIYHALVDVPPPEETATLTNWLLHRDHFAEVLNKPLKGADKAVLHYRLIRRIGKRYMLEIQLETGRYHQIRAQLAAAGMPIIGDRRYGNHQDFPTGGVALHSRQLAFPHPVGGSRVVIEAPYPKAWPRA